jgi:asparagine synthase (glutamine-hydrolysing)
MCGIAGIVQRHPWRAVNPTRLICMRDVLRHRGPDERGLWVEGPVGLAHRRLSIVDLEGGHQPMASEDGNAWIVFNGEIYNHLALREKLEARGHRYRTRSDTETILHLYQEHGERCVEHLQGMFAFALWDRRRRSLLLARDRLGIKPLYYAMTEREILFASEIKAILAAGGISPRLNASVLPEFLSTRFVSSEETFFRGIRKLLPGRTLSWSPERGSRERRYWRLPLHRSEGSKATLRDCAAEVRERLGAAVKSHLMADVPLGLFLSGGLDSSGLAALMARMVPDPIRTFSVGFAEAEANELAYARLVARAVGAEHREIVVSPDEFFAALPRLVWHEDEPVAFPSSVPLYFVSRLAREHVKVVLTGEGADEIFLGYNRYRVTAWNDRLSRGLWASVPGAARGALSGLAKRLPRSVRRYAERSFLAVPPGPRSLFYENFAVFTQPAQEALLADAEALAARDPYAVGLALYQEAGGEALDRMSHADLQTYLVELLMKQDQMSMAASIESRVPFLDHQFVEHVMAIPARFKLRGWQTKAVLRAALADLVPRPILARRKMGFPVPVGRWLRGPHWPLVQEWVLSERALSRGHFQPRAIERLANEHREGRADHGDKLWLLMNLELWQRIFLDGERPAQAAMAA